jgi:hypothetical protein
MAPARPWPLVQGELDGLCGLYSIINSLISGLYSLQIAGHRPKHRSRPLGEREIEALFLLLITRLNRKHGISPVLVGIHALELARLLRHSTAWLSAKRDLQLTFVRPFYRRRRVTIGQVCQTLSNHLAGVGTAAIIGLEWPWRHWTVVTGVTATRLPLLDSSGDPYLSLRRRPRNSERQRRLLRPGEVFLLTLSAKSSG